MNGHRCAKESTSSACNLPPGSNVEPGSLVRIFDDNGCDMTMLCLYLGMCLPAEVGVEVSDLLDDIQFIDNQFKTIITSANRGSQLFYTLPEQWHHVILVGDRIVHLNTGFYTVVTVEDENVSSEQ